MRRLLTLLTALAVAVACSTAVESRLERIEAVAVDSVPGEPAGVSSSDQATEQPELSARPELRRTKSCPWRAGVVLEQRALLVPLVASVVPRAVHTTPTAHVRAPKALGSRGPPAFC